MSNAVNLFDGKLKMDIPDEYINVAEEEQIKNYFSTQKPDIMYLNAALNAYITITRGENELQESEVEERIQQYYNMYLRVTPGFEKGTLAKRETGGSCIGAFHYKSTTLKRDLFNVFCLLPIDEKETVITMHCGMNDAIHEAAVFMRVLSSITIAHGEE